MSNRHYRTGLWLRFYLFLTRFSAPLARFQLRRRLRKGKEDPNRWTEKCGHPSAERPKGTLVWMHAVGVGEVLALPALIEAMRLENPKLQFLITSSARTSAQAIARNLPQGVIHQYLPLDAPRFIHRFLEHWKPDLSIWAERDVWPRFVNTLAQANIPSVIVNGRMNAASFQDKRRLRGLFRDVYRRFVSIDVQDKDTEKHFELLGVDPSRLYISGSLKSVSPALADDPSCRKIWEFVLDGRRVWLAASTHAGEERIILRAHQHILAKDPQSVLILAPRDPSRASHVCKDYEQAGLSCALIENGQPGPMSSEVHVVTEIGQMGLWYRLCDIAFVGGSLTGIGGHNPYEAIRLKKFVLHGPNIANFADDYAICAKHGVAQSISTATDLASNVLGFDPDIERAGFDAVPEIGRDQIAQLASRMVQLI